jgi:hypothetical protein
MKREIRVLLDEDTFQFWIWRVEGKSMPPLGDFIKSKSQVGPGNSRDIISRNNAAAKKIELTTGIVQYHPLLQKNCVP